MLRDSLGGNCRSSFLLTVSTTKLHFEETVATCRFGQRCGEVKVKVSANAEISLFDQLKDMQHKLKVHERRYQVLDDTRRQLEQLLQEERELRAVQTGLRPLTMPERSACKTCVQELLAQAKESLAVAAEQVEAHKHLLITQGRCRPEEAVLIDSNADGHTVKDIANDLVEHTQDALYTTLEEMDKAVLVELSTALGGLVQSLFIDRELVKQEVLIKDSQYKAQQLVVEEARASAQRQRDFFRRGRIEEIVGRMESLPESVVQALLYGAIFLKHASSSGLFMQAKITPRFVSIAPDLRHLLWRTVTSNSSAGHHLNSSGSTAGSVTGGHGGANAGNSAPRVRSLRLSGFGNGGGHAAASGPGVEDMNSVLGSEEVVAIPLHAYEG